jgi:hypothetical protein
MTFGGDYVYKDRAEIMILSPGAESMILSACTEKGSRRFLRVGFLF